VSYRAAAEQVAGWLVSTAERGLQGWCWPFQPGVAPDVEHGLGWAPRARCCFRGGAGPTPRTGRQRLPKKTVLPRRGS